MPTNSNNLQEYYEKEVKKVSALCGEIPKAEYPPLGKINQNLPSVLKSKDSTKPSRRSGDSIVMSDKENFQNSMLMCV